MGFLFGRKRDGVTTDDFFTPGRNSDADRTAIINFLGNGGAFTLPEYVRLCGDTGVSMDPTRGARFQKLHNDQNRFQELD